MDEGPYAHGDPDEDPGCDGTGAPEPEAGLQIQYAPLLVHRKSGGWDGGLLSPSGGRQADAV